MPIVAVANEPTDLQAVVFGSLLAEVKQSTVCVAYAEPVYRRPVLPIKHQVVTELASQSRTVRQFDSGCERRGLPVVAMAWVEMSGNSATIGASRWYGATVHGGILCEVKVERRAAEWQVATPCGDQITAIIN